MFFNNYYLALTTCSKPIKITVSVNLSYREVCELYEDCYGDKYIGITKTSDDAKELINKWYLLFGDIDLCTNQKKINHLERCYQLEYKEV